MTNHYWDRVSAPHADRDRSEPADRDADNAPSDPANAIPVQSIEGGPMMPPEFWEHVQVGVPIDVSPGAFMRVEDAPSEVEREYAEAIHRATCLRESPCDAGPGLDEIEAACACVAVEERHTAALRDRLARVEALHVQDPAGGDWCNEDGFTWPCATARALRGPEPTGDGAP